MRFEALILERSDLSSKPCGCNVIYLPVIIITILDAQRLFDNCLLRSMSIFLFVKMEKIQYRAVIKLLYFQGNTFL